MTCPVGIDYTKRFWELWIRAFGNRKFLDGLDAVRVPIVVLVLGGRRRLRDRLKFLIYLPALTVKNIFFAGGIKKAPDRLPETDILFVSHTERSDVWASQLRLIGAVHARRPDLKLTVLIPSSFRECPGYVRRVDLEMVAHPRLKGLWKYKMLSLKAFLKNARMLLTCPQEKILKDRILINLPEILFRLLQACFRIQFGRRFLQMVRPKGVVVSIDSSSPVSCSAVIEKIPVFQIQHGIREFFYTRFVSDVCYTWGRLSQRWLLKWGALPETLVEGGSLKVVAVMDKFAQGRINAPANPSLSALREIKATGRKIFTYFSQGQSTSEALGREGEKYDMAVSWFLGARSQLDSKYGFVIKLHPVEKDNRPYLKRWGGKALDGVTFVAGSVPIYDVLALTDVAATVKSTSGLDVMLAKVPLIQLFSDEWADVTLWSAHGLSRCASSERLCAVLEDFLSPGKRAEAIKVQDNLLQWELSHRGKEAEVIAADILQRLRCGSTQDLSYEKIFT